MKMYLKRITILIIVCIITISIFAARIVNLITIKHEHEYEMELARKFNNSNDPKLIVGDKFNNIMWFVQISDIHVSIFHDPGRKQDLKDFCTVTIDRIKPTVVLASGDLADGKAIDNMGSDQFVQEWEQYKSILDESGVLNKTTWLDIRGNHDNFNVPGVLSDRSYYHRFSVQGRKHLRSYMHTVTTGEGHKYSFIAVDACLEPGPRRPFNFIGAITEDQFEILKSFESESHNSNGTIWFGHYPTSCILSPNPGIRNLMKSGTAYLCGHLHTLGGTVPNMYTKQHSGVLELELGDWKDNRIFRLAAFDHGMFSFIDVEHRKWPIILVTNPKHALFLLPQKEPESLMRLSTHIRILVFSLSPIEVVRVQLDSESWMDAKYIEGPLYALEWNTAKYEEGLHNMQVYARDSNGEEMEIAHPFSLDGTKLSFRLLPRIALMTDASQVFYAVFLILVALSVMPLIIAKVLHTLVKRNTISKPKIRKYCFGGLFRKFLVLSTINKLFIPVVGYPLYLTVGPWFIGEIIVGHIGAAFAWGTVVHWKILPTSFTYFYGTIQLLGFHIPLVVLLSHFVESRFQRIYKDNKCFWNSYWLTHVPYGFVLLLHAVFAYYFWLAYGTIALILGPLRTWSFFMGIYLWYTSFKLTRDDFKEIESIWGTQDSEQCRIMNGDTSHEM